MVKLIPTKDNFRSVLQRFIANLLFPSGNGDWYKDKGYGIHGLQSYEEFCGSQKNDISARYYNDFKGLNIKVETDIPSELANGESCELERFVCKPEAHSVLNLPGSGKHIIYFPGANTYYQACFRDISTAARETGATVHAFNFPGTGLSTGNVTEANDLTNAGLAMVKKLLQEGVKPDDIILQGDCFGAGVAMEVKEKLVGQTNTKVRVIMNNAFKSFKAAIYDMISSSNYIPERLKSIVKPLLEFTGWHLTPAKKYVASSPYQCLVQHQHDQILPSATMSDKIRNMRGNLKYTDLSPEEYRVARDQLDDKSTLRVKEDAKDRLLKKFGGDKYGRPITHFADLCELETLSGQPAYAGYVNQFLVQSNGYIDSHQQKKSPEQVASGIQFIPQAQYINLNESEKEQIDEFVIIMGKPDVAQEVDKHVPTIR